MVSTEVSSLESAQLCTINYYKQLKTNIMKTAIINMAFSIAVFISSFGLQSCSKEKNDIAPVNTSIIGTWTTVLSSGKTLERQFIKGNTEQAGTGISRVIANDIFGTVTTTPFNWDISGNSIHINNIADVDFIFEITADGKKLIFFDSVNTSQVSFIFTRIN
jgi:hypothetical protein